MPYVIKKRGDKYRIVDKMTGRVARREGGKPADGGGKASKAALKPQMQAMNISYAKKRGVDIPPPKSYKGKRKK
jgi:hypothetical protein